jgi:glycosyltransferase involved in cell wall biosynthesis
MTVSGYTYMRNSFMYGYPVIESIQSVLPLCDEFIAVVGDSSDGTREAIEAIGSEKIRIIDTVWPDPIPKGGKTFAEQAYLGLRACKGDWAFHIQSDEVVHEKDFHTIRQAMEAHLNKEEVEGFLFDFLHFVGDYRHIQTTRRFHRREIRIVRNRNDIYPYKDSQGFRAYGSEEDYRLNRNGRKLKVKLLNVPVFHYSYCRNPDFMLGKVKQFFRHYRTEENVEKIFQSYKTFDFNTVIDVLEDFHDSHPAVMKEKIDSQDWEFVYDPSKSTFSFRHRMLHYLDKLTGWRPGEYRNYEIV